MDIVTPYLEAGRQRVAQAKVARDAAEAAKKAEVAKKAEAAKEETQPEERLGE